MVTQSTEAAQVFYRLLQQAIPVEWVLEHKVQFDKYRYPLDIACPTYKIDVELDGSQHRYRLRNIARDTRRDLFLVEAGWSIIRVHNEEVLRPTPAIELVRLHFPFEVRNATRRLSYNS
jgi:very-short-patch-repair endonuclease